MVKRRGITRVSSPHRTALWASSITRISVVPLLGKPPMKMIGVSSGKCSARDRLWLPEPKLSSIHRRRWLFGGQSIPLIPRYSKEAEQRSTQPSSRFDLVLLIVDVRLWESRGHRIMFRCSWGGWGHESRECSHVLNFSWSSLATQADEDESKTWCWRRGWCLGRLPTLQLLGPVIEEQDPGLLHSTASCVSYPWFLPKTWEEHIINLRKSCTRTRLWPKRICFFMSLKHINMREYFPSLILQLLGVKKHDHHVTNFQ